MTVSHMNAKTASPGNAERAPEPGRGWPLVLVTVAVLCLFGWTYLVAMVADMVPVMDMSQAGPGMVVFNRFNLFHGLPEDARAALAVLCLPTGSTFGMPAAALSLVDLAKIFLMWAMMALAMMLPTTLPMLRAFAAQSKARGKSAIRSGAPVLMAAFGYLTVWFGYAALATFAQWLLTLAGGLNDMMAPASLALTTSVLLAAGLYQFLPAKRACLQRCWYPKFQFAEPGESSGALAGYREGLVQGRICLGCCWAVMTVMFAVGLMNILWIALLGGIMAVEKTFPSRVLPAVIGMVLIVWGGALAISLILPGIAT